MYVREILCFSNSLEPLPLLNITARDLQSSQRNASVQSESLLWLAIFYDQMQVSAGEGAVAKC